MKKYKSSESGDCCRKFPVLSTVKPGRKHGSNLIEISKNP